MPSLSASCWERLRWPRGAEPAWRKLERLMEQKRTSELLSDFDDYDLGDGRRPPRKR
jgi:hypothetical protein